MAPSTIRKAIGAVKDQTSISLAKVASNLNPQLDILIVKATSHDKSIPNPKYPNAILELISYSRDLVRECVCLISKRIERTHDWVVALKCLILVHRLIVEGGRVFVKEIASANASNKMLSNMCYFKDESHSNSWEYTEFVRKYGMFLVKKVELMVFDETWLIKKESYVDDLRRLEEKERKLEGTHLRDELLLERVLSRMERLQRLLQRVLTIRSRCVKRYRDLVILAVTPVVEESFELHCDICEGLTFLSDRFWGMEYLNSVKTYGTYATVAKQFDDLVEFYVWCKDVEVVSPEEYPKIEMISDDLLRSMERFVKKKANETRSSKNSKAKNLALESKKVDNNANGVKLYARNSNVTVADFESSNVSVTSEASSVEEKGDNLALTLFHQDQASSSNTPWQEFSDDGDQSQITTAWEASAANLSNANWELALVAASTSNLTIQEVDFGGSFDAIMLNGMYDQSAIRQVTGGSASSLAMSWPEKRQNAVLALPSTEESVERVNQDPFASSLAVPPPTYVQMSEMEKKFQSLLQEQKIWQQYEADGMQGHVISLMHNETTDNAAATKEIRPHESSSNDLGLL